VGIDSYQKALRINPDHADTYNNMGEALRRKDDFKAAIESFKNALKIIPDYVGTHYNMGTALTDIGELAIWFGRSRDRPVSKRFWDRGYPCDRD
jgi:tetratricopeptide (TPR) repeat protein